MLENHVYDLMEQIVEESKSLWRIKNTYINESGQCEDCKSFWNKMEKDKQDHIEDLQKLIKKHLGQNG